MIDLVRIEALLESQAAQIGIARPCREHLLDMATAVSLAAGVVERSVARNEDVVVRDEVITYCRMIRGTMCWMREYGQVAEEAEVRARMAAVNREALLAVAALRRKRDHDLAS